jgi:beta-mannosidase
MYGSMSLNGVWGLTYAEGDPLVHPRHFAAEKFTGRKLLEAAVPAPIHQVLLDQGIIDDPNLGMNSLKCRWVEEQVWIYRHTFTPSFAVPDVSGTGRAWLCFDKLELHATVWLNGQEVGTHANAHRPARFDVTDALKEGENLLVVQLTAGMHEMADKPGADYHCGLIDLLTKRPWQRRPQYQSGWDWNARLTNIGILDDVRLEYSTGPRLDQVAVFAMASEDLSSATVHARARVEGLGEGSTEATLGAEIVETGQKSTMTAQVVPGGQQFELTLPIDKPELWWPVGHGEQKRYTVRVYLRSGDDTQSVERRTGVRRVEIDQSPHPVEGRYFILKVNNRPIFCKGGNWVPPDLLYGGVPDERYRALVDHAVQANFNMLRIWGGGEFAPRAFAEACDEAGVLVWHDYLFACSKYPGDEPAFAKEVREEVTWATRELAHHPSLVVWCGNNEIEWGDWAWGYDDVGRTHPHYALFHHDIPMISHRENPSTAYWLSSPHSPDFQHPNDATVGDQHPWHVTLLNPGATDFWKYRDCVDRFANEGGVFGASTPATLRQFLPAEEQHVNSLSWDHHDNSFAIVDSIPGELGHAYATVEHWIGRNPLEMSLDDYAFCSVLTQAEGLSEYILNYRRRMYSSAAAVFWMYNDSWPVTNGWTIIDYYLRRKLSFHPVRRAFDPVTVVVAAEGDDVVVFGVNETLEAVSGELRYGFFTLKGEIPIDERSEVKLAPNASTELARLPRKQWESLDPRQSGAFAVLSQEDRLIAQNRLFIERFKDLQFAEPQIEVVCKDGLAIFQSNVFVWAVCLDPDGESGVADDCFDLLPGVAYSIPWSAEAAEPTIARIGSRDAVKGGE